MAPTQPWGVSVSCENLVQAHDIAVWILEPGGLLRPHLGHVVNGLEAWQVVVLEVTPRPWRSRISPPMSAPRTRVPFARWALNPGRTSTRQPIRHRR